MENQDAKAIIEAVERLTKKPEVVEVERGSDQTARVVAVPQGFKLESLKPIFDAELEFPERRKGTAVLTSLAAFIDHANRFKLENSAVFLDDSNKNAPRLVSVFDYHWATRKELERVDEADGPTAKISDHYNPARWLQHRGVYAFPLSDEWNAWVNASKSWLDQREFATFLEDRLEDVLAPEASGKAGAFAEEYGFQLATKRRLLELSKGLSLRVEQRISNHQALSSGEVQFTFEERHADKDGAPLLNMPGGFVIAIPVFRGGELFSVPVRLRYRTAQQNGATVIRWSLAPHNLEKVFEAAISDAQKAVENGTGLPVFRGKPEE